MKDDVTKCKTKIKRRCIKEPRELCAPAGCRFKKYYDTKQTVVLDALRNNVVSNPSVCTIYKHVTNFVPKLEYIEECMDVPKEVCTR